MKKEYIEHIYSGWLAKIIGIRLGAPIEGWTYEKIKNIYGELDHYPVDYHEFAADDDSNGPLFFLKALEDKPADRELTAQDVAEALLNYAPYEHGFFWWGGYGISTEHTAYLNLRNGVKAPMSGSIELNGAATAEQIGGQIFIDTWGLVSPGNPDRAARLAKEAASVTHGGNGIYGGIFVASCIAYAFEEKDIRKIIEKGLSYIPADCEYARAVKDVMRFHDENPKCWRKCFAFIHDNYGYDKYPGNCHIIPNIAVMILSLMYGGGDFSRTLNICNMCGWDTDCNVGNVAAIMGVRNGLDGIDYDKWRRPINDFLACSSVIGSLNIMDIPFGATYIAKLACALAGEEMPEPYRSIADHRIDSCHFEYPGSTHAIRVRVDGLDHTARKDRESALINTDETAFTGERSLKFMVKPVGAAENVYVYKKTHYEPKDFHDSRYDPCFSPLVYPGQTIHGAASIAADGVETQVSLYVRDAHTGKVFEGERKTVAPGVWEELAFQVPAMDGVLIDEMGFCFHAGGFDREMIFSGFIDELYADGKPVYSIDFAKEREEVWTGLHKEISQFTRLKGLAYMAGGHMHLSCADFAEMYTGRYDWTDYEAEFAVTPITGENHMVNVRVQGALRSYAAGLLPDGQFAILKNENGYRTLAQTDFAWETGKEYIITVKAEGDRITAAVGAVTLTVTDTDGAYKTGSIGVSMLNGTHDKYRYILVR